jgi:Exonuclease
MTDEEVSANIAEPPPVGQSVIVPRVSKCSLFHVIGHNRWTCPLRATTSTFFHCWFVHSLGHPSNLLTDPLPRYCRFIGPSVVIPTEHNAPLIADDPPVNHPTTDSTTAVETGLPVVANQEPPPRPQHGGKTPRIRTNTVPIDVEQAIYIVFDLETTGFNSERNYIIDIACEMVTASGNIIPDSKYCSLVKPPTPIPRLITNLTRITYGMVRSRPDFNVIGN